MNSYQRAVTLAMVYSGALVLLHTNALGKLKSIIQSSSGLK